MDIVPEIGIEAPIRSVFRRLDQGFLYDVFALEGGAKHAGGGGGSDSVQALRHALEGALHATFLAMALFAVLTGLVVLLTPNVSLSRRSGPVAAPGQAE